MAEIQFAVREAHEWYMAEDHRTLDDTAWEFHVSVPTLRKRFVREQLPRKSRSTYAGKPQRCNARARSGSSGPVIRRVCSRSSYRGHRRRGWR